MEQTNYLSPEKTKAAQFSIAARIRSFAFAFSGIRTFLVREQNARIHFAATIFVFILLAVFHIQGVEAAMLLMATGLVWITEMINTCVESILDHVSPARHPAVKQIKDIAAGAVLIASIIALCTGAFIFIPHIL